MYKRQVLDCAKFHKRSLGNGAEGVRSSELAMRAFTERRDLYEGFSNAAGRAFEVVFTPLVFGWLGWWIDGRVGTRPLFALTLGILVLLYTLWKLANGYMDVMEREEARVLNRDVER